MPSPAVSDFDYAALFYKDGELPENEKFEPGTKATDGDKLIFSFQRPDDTNGTFTLEIFAFKKGTDAADESTTNFSRENALLSGKKVGCTIDGDEIVVNDPIALAISSTKPGTVRLLIKVPNGCSLEIDDTANFTKSVFLVSDFIIIQNGTGIPAGTYPVTFTVKKSGVIVHIFTEYINVLHGMCTDTWSGSEKGAAKKITQSMISSTVYVRGSGGWYDATSPYNDGDTATADDDINSGSFLAPFATIQKAVDKIIAINDGSSDYTIYIDGTLQCDDSTYVGENGMADISRLTKNLNLTIKALSGTATLDANQKSRVIYAKSSGALNLTLDKLVITGGKLASENGAGIYFESVDGTLTMNDGEISGNIGDNEVRGGGVYVGNGEFIMNECVVSGNSTGRGAGIYVDTGGTVEMNGGTISKNEAVREGGGFGGGVYVCTGDFTMNNGTIRENTATLNGGGVSIGSGGKFTMKGNSSAISDNKADGSGGGVCVAASGGTFTMEGGTISGGGAQFGGGVCNSDTFTMSGSASIPAGSDGKNDVYLAEGKTIAVAGALNATTPVATITPSAYTANRQVLSKGNGVTDTMQGLCDKFKLMNDPDGGEWKIAPNSTGAMGVLKTNACYVRGSDTTWYESNAPSANASDSNSGVRLKPFATIQKAIDTIIAMNDGTGEYTICVDGTLDGTAAAYIGANGMADFSVLNKKLTLTIKALSGTATLDGGARFDADGNATNAGIGKRIIYAKPASGALNLTLENLVIKGGNSDGSGGGIHFESSGGVLTMSGGTITGNTASVHGGGVYVNSGTFEISDTAKISGNVATTGSGGGVFVSGGEFTMGGGTISENKASNGGGVFVYPGAKFTMTGGTISKNEATSNGGGMYVNGNTSLFTMSGGEISGNKASQSGGGICDAGTCTMSVGTISGNTAKYGGGAFVYPGANFTMTDGTISKNEATSNGGTFTMDGGTVSGNTPVDVYTAP